MNVHYAWVRLKLLIAVSPACDVEAIDRGLQIGTGLALVSHELGEERLIVDGAFDRWHPSNADVTATLIQQFSDVIPMICLYTPSKAQDSPRVLDIS